MGEIVSEDVTLIAHSLGGDLAIYLANHCSVVTKLVLLDGVYIDMEIICNLEEELAGAQEYLTSYRFSTLEQAVEKEKFSSLSWSENLEQAVKASLVWDEEEQIWKSSLSFETV